MEHGSDIRKVRFALSLLILWGISLFKSCESLKYKFSSYETQGTVSNVVEQHDRHGSGYEVHFKYNDENRGTRKAYTLVPLSDGEFYSRGTKVDVLYLSDEFGNAEIEGYIGNKWIYVFVGMSLIAIAGVGYFIWDANQLGKK